MKIFNAFSINMLPGDSEVLFERISLWEIGKKNLESYIGHQDTANVISGILGIEPLPMNRQSITLEREETCIIAQYAGSRLPEGATTLPEGAKITFWKVTIS